MRRRFMYIFMILTAVLLVGCAVEPMEPSAVATETDSLAWDTVPMEILPTASTEESKAADTPKPTTAPEPEREVPYLQRIERSDQSIYDGPGYDYCFVDTVRQRGTYTIVEEATDFEGNLWGRLKSGIGWVDLTEIQSETYKSGLISANYADENLLLHGLYHRYPSEQEHSIPIAFRAYGRLRDVALFAIELSDEGLSPGADLFTLPVLTEEIPLVAELAFPGDMSTYGIRFVDESGAKHVFSIYISGRNGALILVEE